MLHQLQMLRLQLQLQLLANHQKNKKLRNLLRPILTAYLFSWQLW